MDVFRLRDRIVCEDYASYTGSFIEIADERIRREVEENFSSGLLWPDPLLQLNPAFASGGDIDELVRRGELHPLCGDIFRLDKCAENPGGRLLTLHRHQAEAIRVAASGANYVLTTGTGSGKSLSYIVPIVDHILKNGTGRGIKAIIVYPMNALANSQELELEKFLESAARKFPVTFRRYTGQENEAKRREITSNPPDILLTNYVMLELILTRPYEQKLVSAARGLQFLVFDELHTYRGRQGADVAMLIRRLRETLHGDDPDFRCIGTSATLAGPGTFAQKQQDVAALATKIFGSEIMPQNVIVETLMTETGNVDLEDAAFRRQLADFLASPGDLPRDYAGFIANPLVAWLENTIGVEMRDGRLERCQPRPLKGKNGLASLLAGQTGIDEERCEEWIKAVLLAGANIRKPNDKPVFAFKLHQFISKGDTVYATLEDEGSRFITLFGQKLAPGRQGALLYPLNFCRECGKEYYSVTMHRDTESGEALFLPLNPAETDEEGELGYLFIDSQNPWPEDVGEQMELLPEDWLVEKKGRMTISQTRKKKLPQPWHVRPDGSAVSRPEPGTTPTWFLRAPFVFCPKCYVSYHGKVKEFTKLGTLGSEGRSTATTILSMSTVEHLREEKDLPERARKFLCFSDNRQDASLQAGHFNDFVEIGLIRSALYNALEQAGPAGVKHNELSGKVFEVLGLGYPDGKFPKENYSVVPEAMFKRERQVDEAFRAVLEYRIYSDLQRGWRIVAPNLEQCGLLEIEYIDLEAICNENGLWRKNGRLYAAPPETRKDIAQAFLDYLRHRLVIRVEALDPVKQEEMARESRLQLIAPWFIEDDEELKDACVAYLRPKRAHDKSGDICLTPAGDFGRWLRSSRAFPDASADEAGEVMAELVSVLLQAGVLERTDSKRGDDAGCQLSASAMLWKAGDGRHARRDRFRVRNAREEFGRTNRFFVELYKNTVKNGYLPSSREHTAQVASELREQREEDFREAKLPILYCSPTMELGVDISQLNVVGMRNVPPTPANYAQRSGRAGRSGQPALILTYCARGNSHDQHFFRAPEQMVAGSVTTPRLDLANEDLVRAHVHAIWLAQSGLDLGKSVAELMDIDGAKPPTLALKESVLAALNDDSCRTATAIHARNMLAAIEPELAGCGWYDAGWLVRTISGIPASFENACWRWRDLYRSAIYQRDSYHDIVTDASQTQKARSDAKKLRDEAERQINILLNRDSSGQSDFYSYRYFASEGFLPGYNFPRLPLSAYITGKRGNKKREEFISRARFLAISEYGPGSIVYHEGSRYAVTGVRMVDPVEDTLPLATLKLCGKCGWLELDTARDICEICGSRLPAPMRNLFRMRNVRTVQKARINSDEEERLRYGYQITSAYRFEEHGGMPSHRDATVRDSAGQPLAVLRYGHGATLLRINMGWANRSQSSRAGFLLDRVKGAWIRDPNRSGSGRGEQDEAYIWLADPATATTNIDYVIPYVEDRKNCLVLEPATSLTPQQMLSLQAALKQAMQQLYQLEDSELSSEVLPTGGEPRTLLFVESSEGGAGVLRHLVDDPRAMPEIALEALRICHFDAEGNDLGGAPRATEPCVVACYDCLMNYANQRAHRDLNRHSIRDILLRMAKGQATLAGAHESRAEHLASLKRQSSTNLERSWLDLLEKHGLNLPDRAQHRLDVCGTVPDFWYEKGPTAIYIDGPPHEHRDRRDRDEAQMECLQDQGIDVIRFAEGEQWLAEIRDHPALFGVKKGGGR